MKKIKEKVEKMPLYWKVQKAMLLTSTAIMGVMTPIVSHATELKDTKLVTGTQTLMTAIIVVIEVIEGGVTVVLAGKEGVKWQAASPEEKPKHVKSMLTIIGGGIVVMCLSGLVPVIFSYYI